MGKNEEQLQRDQDDAIKRYVSDRNANVDPDEVLKVAKVFSGALALGRHSKVPLKYLTVGAMALATYRHPVVFNKAVNTTRNLFGR